jgi:hypothetical protein
VQKPITFQRGYNKGSFFKKKKKKFNPEFKV